MPVARPQPCPARPEAEGEVVVWTERIGVHRWAPRYANPGASLEEILGSSSCPGLGVGV